MIGSPSEGRADPAVISAATMSVLTRAAFAGGYRAR